MWKSDVYKLIILHISMELKYLGYTRTKEPISDIVKNFVNEQEYKNYIKCLLLAHFPPGIRTITLFEKHFKRYCKKLDVLFLTNTMCRPQLCKYLWALYRQYEL